MKLILLTGWAVFAVSYFVLAWAWHWTAANQWILQAGLFWWLVFHQIATRTHLNRPRIEAPLYDHLGWANYLTILRGGLVAGVAGFLFQDWPTHLAGWVPGILYTLAAVIDRLDGFVARKSRQTSLLGTELDTIFDALGLLVAPLLAVWYGQLHWSYLAVSLAYYLYQTGIIYRTKRGLPVHSLPPGHLRRSLAGFQMGFIAVVLLPVFRPPLTTVAGLAFMLPFLAGFWLDWMIASGRIRPNARVFNRLESFSQAVFQPALRIFIAIAVYLTIRQDEALLQTDSHWLSGVYTFSVILAGGLVLSGVLARVSGLLLLLLLGWQPLSAPENVTDVIMICSIIWIMLLGSGRFSIWGWDERWINRYDGS